MPSKACVNCRGEGGLDGIGGGAEHEEGLGWSVSVPCPRCKGSGVEPMKPDSKTTPLEDAEVLSRRIHDLRASVWSPEEQTQIIEALDLAVRELRQAVSRTDVKCWPLPQQVDAAELLAEMRAEMEAKPDA